MTTVPYVMARRPNAFRPIARRAVETARAHLASGDDSSLKYAALELRIALENLTYERASIYESELPDEAFCVWQPKRLLESLLEIDPSADQTRQLSATRTERSSDGTVTSRRLDLGTDRVVSCKEIKKHYDALGSFLHAPTIKQVEDDERTAPERIRKRCEAALELVTEAASSKVYRSDIRTSFTMQCIRCDEHVIRRVARSDNRVIATCPKCRAEYGVTRLTEDKAEWMPLQYDVACESTGCDGVQGVWKDEYKQGSYWCCDSCGGLHELAVFARFTKADSLDPAQEALVAKLTKQ